VQQTKRQLLKHILQHSYNKATHSSTGFSPFEVCLGFQPTSPTELPLTLAPQGTLHQQREQLSAQWFLQQIQQCHIAVTSTLKETQHRAKEIHDKQRTTISYQPGDRVWLHLDKKHFKGQHHKILPIRYGPYTILQKVGENGYKLDLPPQLGIHNVINVNHLKMFEPPILEEVVTITHPVDNIPDFQLPLAHDTLLDCMTCSTSNKDHTSYLVARQGQTLTQAKWMTSAVVQSMLPHLLMEARVCPDINKEELGQGDPPKGALHSSNIPKRTT